MWHSDILPISIQSLLVLGKWDKLDYHLTSNSGHHTFEYQSGQLIRELRNFGISDKLEFNRLDRILKIRLNSDLALSSRESYAKAYETITQLHKVYEIGSIMQILREGSNMTHLQNTINNWKYRIKQSQLSMHTQEPILEMRRISLQILQQKFVKDSEPFALLQNCIVKQWLQSIKLFKKLGHRYSTYSALISASTLKSFDIDFEMAKWLWNDGQKSRAYFFLESIISHDDQVVINVQSKARLQLIIWMEETCPGNAAKILEHYQSITMDYKSYRMNKRKINFRWDKAYFHTGKYYNSLYEIEMHQTASKVGSYSAQAIALLSQTCKNYGKALLYGTKYIYQTLPRMLTLWLDFGSHTVKGKKFAHIFHLI